jgi:hypothetical protein
MADAFPPQPYDEAFKQLAIYDAWYSNNMDAVPATAGSPTHIHNGYPHSGGLQGRVSSGLFGTPSGQNRPALSIPVAGDLAQLSADLLFAESPKVLLPDAVATKNATVTPERKRAQERLELIVSSDAAHAELLRAGEYSAAHGGAYLAIVWDKAFREHVWFRASRADCVIPEWKYGELAAATLWTDYVKTEDTYRLFERHIPGSITYSLFKGTSGTKGSQVPVDAITETAHYLKLIDASDAEVLPMAATLDVVVRTGVPWLTVEYFPNMLPNPMWDKQGALANLGRSDFFGLESLFTEINQLWSSLKLDFANGMGRLTVPESYLRLKGRGQGAEFDYGRSVYSPVGGLVDDGKGGTITISQFKIRVAEHLDAIDALKREIATTAGYSPSHMGLKAEAGSKTATEVNDDKSDSRRTRDKKALYVRPALARLARTGLAIDALVFPNAGGQLIMELPSITFAPVSQVDPLVRAQTVQAIDAARAMSTETRVAYVQPDLDAEEMADEVARVKAENGLSGEPPADPTTFGRGGEQPPPEPTPDAEEVIL